jgi:hypothetical protein
MKADLVGKRFRLIGRTTVFTVVHQTLVGGFIPAITGHTEDERFQTQPRVADVIFLEDRAVEL